MGWVHLWLQSNAEGGSTHSPRGAHGVRAPRAAEEHTWCVHPWLWRSALGVCTHTHVEAQRVCTPTAAQEFTRDRL